MAEVETKTNETEVTDPEQKEKTTTEKNDPEQKEEKKIDVDSVKKEAVSDYLKSLGYEDDEKLKGIIAKAKEDEEKNKSDLEKKEDIIRETTSKLIKETERANIAEAKLAAINLGAKPELVDDLVTIAKAKVTKEKDINKIIAEIKDGSTGSIYFGEDEEPEDKKHGKNVTRVKASKNTKTKDDDNEGAEDSSFAKRIFANKKKQTKSSYFN